MNKENITMALDLTPIRKEIDVIDTEITLLLKRRFSCSNQIAEIKSKMGLPLYDPLREENILNDLKEQLGDEESSREIFAIFESILQQSKIAQSKHLSEVAARASKE